MPQYTAHFRLGYRTSNEQYSAAVDRERMTTIDAQMAALTAIVGDGRLRGWTFASSTPGTVAIRPGDGIVGGVALRTLAPAVATMPSPLPTTGLVPIYLARRPGGPAAISDLSDKVGFTVVDATPPSAPVITGTTFDGVRFTLLVTYPSDAVSLRLYRATADSSPGWAAATVIRFDAVPSVADEGWTEGTTLYYRITAIDRSGNESTPSTAISYSFPPDLTPPADPLGLTVYAADGLLQAEWLASPTSGVTGYSITSQKIDALGEAVGGPTTLSVGEGVRIATFAPLDNGARYRVAVRSVSRHAVTSAGLSAEASPRATGGPSEVSGLTVTPQWDGRFVSLLVAWTPGAVPGAKHQIVVTEAGTARSTVTVGPGSTATISLLTDPETGAARRLREATDYAVRVRPVSAVGVAAVGVVASTKVPRYTAPAPVTSLTLSVVDGNRLEASWRTPASAYARVRLSVSRTDLTTNTSETLVSGLDVGKSSRHRFVGFGAALNSRYTVTAVSEDGEGGTSAAATAAAESGEGDTFPEGVSSLSVRLGIGVATVAWQPPASGGTTAFNVWKSTTTPPTPESFSLLATLPPDTVEVADHDVSVGTTYLYAVTAVNAYGQESDGPANGSFSMNWVSVTPRTVPPLSRPTGLFGSLTGSNYALTWDDDDEAFDGYQILRAVNGFDFEPVGATARGVRAFTDTGLPLRNGDVYRYAVRKVSNEADLFAVGPGEEVPDESLFVGAYDCDNDEFTQSSVVDILDMVDPVTAATLRRLAEHRHEYLSDDDDRRVRLDDALSVNDWASADGYVYTTATTLPAAGVAVVRVNGEQTPLLYSLDRDAGTLTLEQPLGVGDVLSVVFPDEPETQGLLPGRRISSVNAVNVDRGTLRPAVLQPPSHDGLGEAPCSPATTPMTPMSRRRTRFSGSAVRSDAPACFYAVAETASGRTLGGTSVGVKSSDDVGVSFGLVCPTSSPVNRLLCTDDTNYAAAGGVVFANADGTAAWAAIDGAEGVGLVRDLCEDAAGRIYAATDVGVFCLDTTLLERRWRACAPVDRWTTNCGAIFYEPSLLSVVVSTDAGLFYSPDAGATWSLWSAWDQPRRAHDHVRAGGTSFLLTDDRLYRRRDGDATYSQVALFDARCRGLKFWRNRLYVSTERGLLASAGDVDGAPVFGPALPQLSHAGVPRAVTAMGVSNDRLLCGVDTEMFVSTRHGGGAVQYVQRGAKVPAVYVNGAIRMLGVYVNATTATFDDPPGPDDDVRWASSYGQYVVAGGGWADLNYAAPLALRVDGRLAHDPAATLYTASVSPENLSLPSPSARFADLDAYESLRPSIEAAVETASASPTPEAVARLSALLDEASQRCDPSVQIPRPTASATLGGPGGDVATVDPVTGIVSVVSDSLADSLTKYTRVSLAVRGVSVSGAGSASHREADDAFECRMSGADAGTSLVTQVNGIKADLFAERAFPGERASLSPAARSVVAAGCDGTWYDRFRSTADYALRFRKNPDDVSVSYAACAAAVPADGRVWAGGVGGVVAMAYTSGEFEVRAAMGEEAGVASAILPDEGDGPVLVATDLGLWEVDPVALTSARDSATGYPAGVTSLARVNGTLFAGAADGVYAKRIGAWERVLPGTRVLLRYLGDLMLAADAATGEVFSSPTGEGWTSKGRRLAGRRLTSVAKFGGVFFATDAGLFEDGRTFYAEEMVPRAVNVSGGGDVPRVNDIAADDDGMVVALSDGRYYAYAAGGGTGFVGHDVGPLLGGVQRAVLAGGTPWLFGYDCVAVGTTAVARLATGRRVTWQP